MIDNLQIDNIKDISDLEKRIKNIEQNHTELSTEFMNKLEVVCQDSLKISESIEMSSGKKYRILAFASKKQYKSVTITHVWKTISRTTIRLLKS
jgi:hypothetical protein